MQNFSQYNSVKIVFGKETENEVGSLCLEAGAKKVLLHYGGGSIKKSGLYDRVIKSLNEAGVTFVELGGVVANPRLSMVYKGIELCKKENVDLILAVGGGSVIDSSKAIAAGLKYDGDVWDLFMGTGVFDESVPVATVLTIPAAGSEASTSCVITKEEGALKKDIDHKCLRPVFSITNPELTFTLPSYQTGCGIVDMCAHIMERYFTQEPNVEVSDRMSEGLLKAITTTAPRLLADPNNYDYRAEIMWAGTLAHDGLLGRGRIEDWSSHMIEHELSGLYDIAHGAGLSIVFPAWMKYVYKSNLARFAQWANRVYDIEINPHNLEETALKGIDALESFFKSLDMPIRLSEAGIPTDAFEEMAKKATQNGKKAVGSFKPLSTEDIIEIFKLAK